MPQTFLGKNLDIKIILLILKKRDRDMINVVKKDPDYLNQCPRQKEIVEFLKKNPGATESEILLNVYGCDRTRGDNNKAGADALRRAMHNGFVSRRQNKMPGGIYKYFAVQFGAIKFVYHDRV